MKIIHREELARLLMIGTVDRKDTMRVGTTFRPDTAYTRKAENTAECNIESAFEYGVVWFGARTAYRETREQYGEVVGPKYEVTAVRHVVRRSGEWAYGTIASLTSVNT